VKTNVQNQAQQDVAQIGNQIDEKNNMITSLENTNKDLQAENNRLNEQLQQYVGTDGTLESMDALLATAASYMTERDVQQTAQSLEQIRESVVLEETSESFRNLYEALVKAVGPEVAQASYDAGYASYQAQKYEEAAVSLQKAVDYDPELADAWYYLGRAYHLTDEKEKAVECYEKFVEMLPNTQRAGNARRYIEELSE